ncbi:histidinol-phosphate transaminase [Hoyosella sp. YIM 151337]|uniref:histidinol-phosphate transaminase n=1 Tax=Hoyosella sp. YIM 151337 TaxID=2992742 RepID=UPI0022359D61|nr:histidinol-phosphate transaminase [Hoyosella sp. YIM 151337]MCW4352636.1 histidinol-phosphate transaminase [Hoyosella sp. YIM 151337]
MSDPAPTARTRPDLASIPVYVPGKSWPGAIKLASNETSPGPLPSVVDAITRAAAEVNRYPDNGALALKSALADELKVGPEHVSVGCGSVSLCQQLVQATCGPGDEVLFAWRSFEAYPLVSLVAGATPVKIALDRDAVHDLDAMVAAITPNTRLIFVCNPNNPTGTAVGSAALERFLDAVPSHILVVLDEAYFEYLRPDGFAEGDLPDGVELQRSRSNVVVLRTFSKAYGLAGLRVGYAVGHPEVITTLGKVYVPFSANSIAQAAAIASLEAAKELLHRTDAVVKERERVRDALTAAGYRIPETQANFVWLDLGASTEAFAARCAEAGVLIRPFAGEGARVTIGTPAENDVFLRFALSDSAAGILNAV